jgi:hypothetical protein
MSSILADSIWLEVAASRSAVVRLLTAEIGRIVMEPICLIVLLLVPL